jgi:hypothetical protein
MTSLRTFMLLGALALGISGCSTFDKLTGSVDDTVLPGQREDAIPGRAKFPDTADPTVEQAPQPLDPPPASGDDTSAACPPDDPACAPPAGDDTFSDPQ